MSRVGVVLRKSWTKLRRRLRRRKGRKILGLVMGAVMRFVDATSCIEEKQRRMESMSKRRKSWTMKSCYRGYRFGVEQPLPMMLLPCEGEWAYPKLTL